LFAFWTLTFAISFPFTVFMVLVAYYKNLPAVWIWTSECSIIAMPIAINTILRSRNMIKRAFHLIGPYLF